MDVRTHTPCKSSEDPNFMLTCVRSGNGLPVVVTVVKVE